MFKMLLCNLVNGKIFDIYMMGWTGGLARAISQYETRYIILYNINISQIRSLYSHERR